MHILILALIGLFVWIGDVLFGHGAGAALFVMLGLGYCLAK